VDLFAEVVAPTAALDAAAIDYTSSLISSAWTRSRVVSMTPESVFQRIRCLVFDRSEALKVVDRSVEAVGGALEVVYPLISPVLQPGKT